MHFGEVRTDEGSDGDKVVEIRMSRQEVTAFAYVVQALVERYPAGREKDNATSVAHLAIRRRDELVRALVAAQRGRLWSVVTLAVNSLDDVAEELRDYPQRGVLYTLPGLREPADILAIAQTARGMHEELAVYVDANELGLD